MAKIDKAIIEISLCLSKSAITFSRNHIYVRIYKQRQIEMCGWETPCIYKVFIH